MRVHVTAEVQSALDDAATISLQRGKFYIGVRELKRCIERHVASPISDQVIEGVFQPNDMIDVLMVDGELTFRKGKPRSKDRAAVL